MLVAPPPWVVLRSPWYSQIAWVAAAALSESLLALWLRELASDRGRWAWLGVLGGLLALRVTLSWFRDLRRESLVLEAGNGFAARIWSLPHRAPSEGSWLSREGREGIESGTRAALEMRSALATLALSVPLLVYLAPWLSLSAILAMGLVGVLARTKAKAWKALGAIEGRSQEEFIAQEEWAHRAGPEATPRGTRALVARARRAASRAWTRERRERVGSHLGWGAAGEALAHFAGWALAASALVSWTLGRMPPGNLFAFLGVCLLAYRPVREAGRQFPQILRARHAWDRLNGPAATVPRREGDLVVRGLSLVFAGGPAVLRGIDFTLAPGEAVFAHGPNGCGKSSLLSVLAGNFAPTSGTWSAPRRRFHLAQEPVLPPLPPKLWTGIDIPRPESLDGLVGILFPAGIPESLDWNRPVPAGGHHLSRGQRARLALLAAVGRPTPLWLLDEPLSAIPPSEAPSILEAVLVRRRKAAVLVAQPDLPIGFAAETIAPPPGWIGPRLSRLDGFR